MSSMDITSYEVEDQVKTLLHLFSEASYKLKLNRSMAEESKDFLNYHQMKVCMDVENKVLLNTMNFIEKELLNLYKR